MTNVMFGKRLAGMRHKQGLTQVQLADLIKVSQATVSQLENGEHHPTVKTLKALCRVLKCQPNDLLIG